MSGAALVHDYFVQDGGAERVAIELANLLPRASIHTTFFDEPIFSDRIDPARVRPWRLNRPALRKRFRAFLPLYPAYFSTLDLRDRDLVVSSSSAFAKAIRTSRRATHVAYIHAPMRFAWQYQMYSTGSSLSPLARTAGRLLGPPLRAWDRRTSQRPDVLVANSQNIRARIQRFWGRDAEVIFPPVDVDEFDVPVHDGGYLLVAARLLAYRRVDLAVAAATQTGRSLVVVGDGPERRALEARAGSNVRFEGAVSRERLIELMAGCSAYLVPGEEDFGIAPIEAMACGKPVVALGRGGTAETVVDGETGVHFTDQTPRGLIEAMERLDALSLDPEQIRAHAQRFGTPRFLDEFRDLFRRLGVDPAFYALG
jgi:glycosyltransferase involved in cell wall biosynthesis